MKYRIFLKNKEFPVYSFSQEFQDDFDGVAAEFQKHEIKDTGFIPMYIQWNDEKVNGIWKSV